MGDLPDHRERLCARLLKPERAPEPDRHRRCARGPRSATRCSCSPRFLTDDVSLTESDVPSISGHRQVTDAQLLTLARRRGMRLVTFDAAVHVLAGGHDVELLTTL
jgi:uncharacterized protein